MSMASDSDEVMPPAQERLIQKRESQHIGPAGNAPAKRRAGDVMLDEVMAGIARKAAARGQHLREVPPAPEIVFATGDDGYEPHIRPGVYCVAYLDETKATLHRRPNWVIRFRVIDGDAAGIVLRMYVTRLPEKAKPTPGWAFVSLYVAATQLRPPSDLWRYSPSQFLEGCAFDVRVVDVKKDSNGIERPVAAFYSRIKCLVARTVGTPPCLRTRHRS